jgi:predicted Zn finger-like uncharacterized protein
MTVFHISAAELRAADGAVVCGECGTTFDALGTLSETPPTEPPAPLPPAAPAVPDASPPAADEDAVAAEAGDEAWEDDALEPADARDEDDFLEELESLIGSEETPPEDAEPLRAEGEPSFDGAVEEDWEDHGVTDEPDAWGEEPADQAQDELLDGVLDAAFDDPFNEPFREPFGTPFVGADDGAPDMGKWKLVPALGEEQPASGDSQPAAAAGPDPDNDADGSGEGKDKGTTEHQDGAAAGDEAEDVPEFAAREPRRRRGLKLTLALVALLCIGAAWAHSQRGMLLRHPAGEAVLGPVYSLLGLEAAPRWSPGEFRALKWEAGADPARPDRLVVAIEFLNGASFAQPYPLLRVVLEDRFGRRVGAHDIEPGSYLEGHSRGRRLPAGGRVRSTVEVPDPGARAEGFRVDFCLESGSDGLVCSADSAR